MAGGMSSSKTLRNAAWVFNDGTFKWTKIGPISEPKSHMICGKYRVNTILCLGGINDRGKVSQKVEMLDVETKTWKTYKSEAGLNFQPARAVDYDGKLEFIGIERESQYEPGVVRIRRVLGVVGDKVMFGDVLIDRDIEVEDIRILTVFTPKAIRIKDVQE